MKWNLFQIVLSGKMTLSVINDELIKALSEKDEGIKMNTI